MTERLRHLLDEMADDQTCLRPAQLLTRLRAHTYVYQTAETDPLQSWVLFLDSSLWRETRRLATKLFLIEQEVIEALNRESLRSHGGSLGVAGRLTPSGWDYIGGFERRLALSLLGRRPTR